MKFATGWTSTALAVCLAGTLPAHSQAGPADGSQSALLRATSLMGTAVRNPAGKEIAKVEDLIVDAEKGVVSHAVLSVGGFLGVGERLVAYPLPAAEASLEGATFVIDTNKQKLQNMKGFDSKSWPDFNSPGFVGGKNETAGTSTARPYTGDRFRRASEMVKAQLRDPQGKDVGDVKDLLVRAEDARVGHVVVEFDRSWYDKGGWVALPMSSVRGEGRDFVATFKPDHIRPAEGKDARTAQQAVPKPEAHAKAAERPAADRDERVSKLVGRKVVDPAGKDLARVKDLVIDTQERRVAYAILSVGGFLKVGDKPVAYPLPAREAWISGDKIVLESSQEKLKAMPEYQVERPYEGKGPSRFMRASDLLGVELVDQSGRDVGDLRDIVVNLASGEVRYVVADFDSAWVQDGKLFAIPFRQLQKSREHHDPVMQFGLNELHGWMIFDEGKWPDLNDPRYRAQVDRYARAR